MANTFGDYFERMLATLAAAHMVPSYAEVADGLLTWGESKSAIVEVVIGDDWGTGCVDLSTFISATQPAAIIREFAIEVPNGEEWSIPNDEVALRREATAVFAFAARWFPRGADVQCAVSGTDLRFDRRLATGEYIRLSIRQRPGGWRAVNIPRGGEWAGDRFRPAFPLRTRNL